MKKLALMMVAAMITSLTFAQKLQEKDVPAPVKTAFQKNFPQAKVEKWEKEGINFEAEFELNKSEQSVLFDAQGDIIETEIEIEISELPYGIVDYVKTNYKGQSVKEAAKISDTKGTLTYEAEIKGMDLLFDSNGKFIKEIKN
ncbi:MAG: PepSY-like domain-containing protein [Flavobacteriales bacterium]|nr:PepSY-like domain-containing protein [Flavobacteriales bacterium]